MRIVAVGHYSRTGKDSFANYLVQSIKELHPAMKVKKVSLAWKLKQVCFDLYGWAGVREPEFYDTPEGEPFRDIMLPDLGMTPVELWVKVGTPALREQVYDRTWIDYLFKTPRDLDVMVVPDIRFENEILAARQADPCAIIGKVVRPGKGPRNTGPDRQLLGYSDWDFVIGGSGRMSELQQFAGRVARALIFGQSGKLQTDADMWFALSVERGPFKEAA
jgi:hypothetical protein